MLDLKPIKEVAKAAASENATLSERRRFYTSLNASTLLEIIERMERAESAVENPLLAGIQIHNGAMEMGLKGGAAQMLAEAFVEQFKQTGGVNYVELRFESTDRDVGSMLVTLQRVEGKTPGHLKHEAEERAKRAEALLRESQDSIGGDWRARRDALLAEADNG